ncbi:MAG: cytochrome c, partial [Planctomycetales bacterium]|nr:cytochrome c [Planctomycetales bacterium]
AGRQQFLDLLRYLIEIRDGGQLAARNLEPAPHLYAARPIPAYEQNIDHAAMIAELGDENFKRGKAIYQRVCANCHGTHDTMGSLPTSLRFATGQFKNGSDPYTMYQTLTRGFGMMQPQTWMVPQQKYDVIHYIRQAYLKRHNASQYVEVTDAWLKSLPTGSSRGPDAQVMEPWITMDYGPMLINTYEIGDDGHNFAYKGIAVRLDHGPGGVARGRHWMIFDHDTLRVAAAWSGSGFIDWAGIHFDGQHGRHPRVVGAVAIENRTGPGWQHPTDETWEDTRIVGRDGRRYGPLPREWGDYQGVYRHDDRAIIAYRIGTTDILESPLLLADQPTPVFARRIELQPHASSLTLRVADLPADATSPASINSEHVIIGNQEQNAYLVAGVRDATATTEWIVDDRSVQLRLQPSNTPASLTLWFTSVDATDNATGIVQQVEGLAPADGSLSDSIHGGEPTMPDVVTTQPVVGSDDGSFAVDVLTYPDANPWLARVRLTGFDFFEDGDSLAICSWDGDVWKVTGVDLLDGPLTWRRVARGLFQPLGLRIVDGEIFVTCRDQLVKLHDLNGDDEIDHYESFNHDHQVTEHF